MEDNADKDAKLLEKLTEPVQMFESGDKSFPVSRLDAISSQVRNTVVEVLKIVDPAGYAEYRKLKYASGENPSLVERRAAYLLAFKKFLEATYNVPGF
ncbi:MAG: hypothetical protein WCT04_24945 [Planctomycetota bacterium]